MKGVDVVLFTCQIVFWIYASSRSGVTWCDANFSRCSINVRSGEAGIRRGVPSVLGDDISSKE